MFLEGGKAYRTIAEELGIRNSQQIERWVHDYRREGEMGLMKPKRRPRKKQEG